MQLARLHEAEKTNDTTALHREAKKPSQEQIAKQQHKDPHNSCSSGKEPNNNNKEPNKNTKDVFDAACGAKKSYDEINKSGQRKVNTTSKTEFMNKIRDRYRYDKTTGKYKLIDGKEPIKCSITGKDVIYTYWDHTHGEVEAFYNLKTHLGAIDPETFEMYKLPELCRSIKK